MLEWLKRAFGFDHAAARPQPEACYLVAVDEIGVRCRLPSGETQSVTWNDLDAVVVETNDSGPWGADVWWRLLGRDGASGYVVPQGASGEEALLDRLFALDGFDHQRFIAAMSCAENQRFLCWRRTTS